jgi:Integrase core domain
MSYSLKSVIGLKNLDAQSTQYRSHKQTIERLNRTYKYHVQSQNGFDSINGSVAKLVLFVTHYNFLRPHKSLAYKMPIDLPEVSGLATTQAKWLKIISLAA